MRSSEKIFSKRNCTHHQHHRRRHPVPFLILTCVRQPQRPARRLPSRNHQGAAVSDCRLIECDFQVAHLETRKTSAARRSLALPIRSAENFVGRATLCGAAKGQLPYLPATTAKLLTGRVDFQHSISWKPIPPTLPAHLGRWAKLFQPPVRTAVCVGSRVTAKVSS